jgi:predicted negative regulator of RcsB-dependent stress response
MTVRKYPDKRSFPRHRANIDIDLIISGKQFRARLFDFSLDGLGVLIKDARNLGFPLVHAAIKDIGMDADGETRWTRTISEGVLAGIHLLGHMKGMLGIHRLSDVLLGLKRRGKTGILEVEAGSAVTSIYLKRGEVILPASKQEQYSVCEPFLESGRINADQYDRALEAAKETGKRHSTVLVEMGYVTVSELADGIRAEAERVMLDLFACGQGRFIFKDDSLPDSEVIALRVDVENLVCEGIRKIREVERIRSGAPPMDAVLHFVVDPSRVAKGTLLNGDDKKVLPLINGRRTVRDILSLSPLDEIETLRSVCVLHNLQIIESAENSDASEDKSAGQKKSGTAVDPVFAERIEQMYRELKSLNYYGVFNVSKAASAGEIKRAYHRMAKEFHPDRYLNIESDSMREKLHAIFSHISEAYRELIAGPKTAPESSSPPVGEASRGEYNKTLAMARFKEGMQFYSSGKYEQAATVLGQAVYLNDAEPEYHYSYAMALLRNKKVKPAEEALRKASQRDPFNSKYVTELGHIYLELGFHARAKSAFERALKYNASDERALEGMQRLKS